MIGYKIQENVLQDLESLRREGSSIKSIALQLGIAKSTVSKYCKNIKLSEVASDKLKMNIKDNGLKASRRNKQNFKIKQDLLEEKAKSFIDFKQSTRVLIQQLCEFGLTQKRIANLLNIVDSAVEYALLSEISKKNRIKRISQIRKNIKSKLVDYSGNKCIKCDYDKCVSSLAFHHVDPTQKEFTISQAKHRNYDRYKEECDKCLLLCHNCHGEFHEGLWEISGDMINKQIKIRLSYDNLGG